MNYTDEQLKQALAKMLPNEITYYSVMTFYWNRQFIAGIFQRVLDAELLHLCWLAEKQLNDVEANWYSKLVNYHSDWQQRVIALAKVKGIEMA